MAWAERAPLFFVLILSLTLPACAQKQTAITAHGKPVSFWLDELRNSDPQAREQAVNMLGNVGKADEAVMPALIGAVADADPGVRDAAVLALLNIGPDAAAGEDTLNQALSDPDATVRAHAAKALERVRGSP